MFDIVINALPKSIDSTNVLLTCLAGNLTIFAFGYPYIYRAINNLANISSILTNRVRGNIYFKFYPIYIIFLFILNAISLLWFDSIVWGVSSVILLLGHIFYIMALYHYIETKTLEPFKLVINKEINEHGLIIKKDKELENDINLVLDLICYAEKITINEPDLYKYFDWLTNVTFFNFKTFDNEKFDFLFGIKQKYYNGVFCTLYKTQWLNQWAVDYKKRTTLYYIANFYQKILEYSSVDVNKTDNTKQNEIKKVIQNTTLEYLKQVILYRINHDFVLDNEMEYFVNLFYFILLNKLNNKQNDKFEPCFSILSKMIDYDMSEEYYHQMIYQIQNNRSYFYSKKDLYFDICSFHISIIAYFIFKNQYKKLKSYIHYEEPPERTKEYTRPQIPNTINIILFNFIGSDSVFRNTQTFSANVSSRKYKFYVLFLLLINSKKFAEKCNANLSKIKKTNYEYKFIENDFKRYNECSINFDNIPFDNLMSFLYIEKYKEYLDKFCLETELLNILECQNDDLTFIEQILDDTIKKIKKSQSKLLRRQFKNIVKSEFSQYMQDNLKVKNLDNFINLKIYRVYESIKKIIFSCTDDTNLKNFYLDLYDKVYNKRKLLSGQYRYVFDYEPMNDFYSRLFNLLIENCQELPSINHIPLDTISNYQILSNFRQRQTFISFGFERDNIKVKKCTINGKEENDSDYADVNLIKINDTDIMISEHNNNFSSLNNNGTYPYTIIIFDPKKISIEVGEEQPIKFNNIKGGNVQILDDTQINIKLPKDKSFGYYISLPNKKD